MSFRFPRPCSTGFYRSVTRTNRRKARFFGAIREIFRVCDHTCKNCDHTWGANDAASQRMHNFSTARRGKRDSQGNELAKDRLGTTDKALAPLTASRISPWSNRTSRYQPAAHGTVCFAAGKKFSRESPNGAAPVCCFGVQPDLQTAGLRECAPSKASSCVRAASVARFQEPVLSGWTIHPRRPSVVVSRAYASAPMQLRISPRGRDVTDL